VFAVIRERERERERERTEAGRGWCREQDERKGQESPASLRCQCLKSRCQQFDLWKDVFFSLKDLAVQERNFWGFLFCF
jgi:hypothetical protein